MGFVLSAQRGEERKVRCGTVEYYNKIFRQNPSIQQKFSLNQRAGIAGGNSVLGTTVLNDTITLVVHVVGSAAMQQLVTTAVIQSQVDVLNEDYQGLNRDSVRIPLAFKSRFGKSNLNFKLAGTNPYGEPTTGIVRRVNNVTYNAGDFENVKSSASGGDDTWDPTKYLNIWIVDFGTSDALGISVFPGDPRPLNFHGFVCDYRAFGRDAPYLFKNYNRGRTTTHELGHFFNLNHIWGDDNGSCSGSDFPDNSQNDDTPNQADATEYNPDPSGIGVIIRDNCSPLPPGIMYQNFMDYTFDSAMVLFTHGQQARMENTLSSFPDRAPLLASVAYRAAAVFQNDAAIRRIVSPLSTVCSETIVPVVTLRNSGTATLTAVRILLILNGGGQVVYNWTGNLPSYTEVNVTLPAIKANTGRNTLSLFTSLPNGANDERSSNDASSITFDVISSTPLLTSVNETFSGPSFPPPGWKINNSDGDETWKLNPAIGKNAVGSAWFNDWNNPFFKRFDDLVSPAFSITGVDSLFLFFNLAAATFSNPRTLDIDIDTLSVLLTKDCGSSFTTVYKKWGEQLQTLGTPAVAQTREFLPTASQWRRDSVNIGSFIDTPDPFQLYFRVSGNSENNIFIDDVAIVPKNLPLILKERGFLIFPTLFREGFFIQHYKLPAELRAVQVFNSVGQLTWSKEYKGDAANIINVNLQNALAGVYFLRMIYTDGRQNITQRIVKQR
jgi:hypothetical protein